MHTRALCNGKTLAFQAKDAGSIPAARSRHIQFSPEKRTQLIAGITSIFVRITQILKRDKPLFCDNPVHAQSRLRPRLIS